jgi:hypothetical protein
MGVSQLETAAILVRPDDPRVLRDPALVLELKKLSLHMLVDKLAADQNWLRGPAKAGSKAEATYTYVLENGDSTNGRTYGTIRETCRAYPDKVAHDQLSSLNKKLGDFFGEDFFLRVETKPASASVCKMAIVHPVVESDDPRPSKPTPALSKLLLAAPKSDKPASIVAGSEEFGVFEVRNIKAALFGRNFVMQPPGTKATTKKGVTEANDKLVRTRIDLYRTSIGLEPFFALARGTPVAASAAAAASNAGAGGDGEGDEEEGEGEGEGEGGWEADWPEEWVPAPTSGPSAAAAAAAAPAPAAAVSAAAAAAEEAMTAPPVHVATSAAKRRGGAGAPGAADMAEGGEEQEETEEEGEGVMSPTSRARLLHGSE